MIEYIKNIIPRIKRYSQKVDKEELLIDKTWVWVDFNSGYTTFHFLRDNRLLISQMGNVQEGKWEFIGNNQLLNVKGEGFNVLLNQGILFEGVLIMQKQGVFDSYEVLYDEQLIPDGDVIQYIEDQLSKVISISGLDKSKKDYPFTVFAGETEITLHQEPRVGMTIYSSENFNGKVYGLPKYMGVEVLNNRIKNVFLHAEVTTDEGVLLLEIENCDWELPRGSVFFKESNKVPDGEYNVISSNPDISSWEKFNCKNGKILNVSSLSNVNIFFIAVFSLLILMILVWTISSLIDG
jgi:hypothetical protein